MGVALVQPVRSVVRQPGESARPGGSALEDEARRGLLGKGAVLMAAAILIPGALAFWIGVSMLLVSPAYFAEAMGHMPGDPMGEAMGEATLAAFTDAIRQAGPAVGFELRQSGCPRFRRQ